MDQSRPPHLGDHSRRQAQRGRRVGGQFGHRPRVPHDVRELEVGEVGAGEQHVVEPALVHRELRRRVRG
jgi:hypothetical protein